MTIQRQDRTKNVFLDAVELPPGERQAYLAAACGEDLQLRREVEALLEHHEGLGAFLETAAVERSEPLLEQPGTVIGPYRLLEQIGEGGFGVVFMAEQTHPVKRRVALKVIKPGMDTRQVIARFEAERQALALMDHPNIARVLDAGATETGRPFFVMELVRGMPITEYCDQAQLTPRERLELFVAVCHAMQHAHQKGIIHRDIKPTNVLVTQQDDRPVVKVIDFGVAKATSGQLTDKTLFTGFAQVIGTPLYMSPEQTALGAIDIDTRSDIYSLGVLLYELLTGTTPFDRGRLERSAFDEVRRIIREEEPEKPSTRISTLGKTLAGVSALRRTEPRKLSQLVKGDLDRIAMKALEKDRTRRYETANEFAADVLRYLTDEPVLACPPSAAYRLRKLARRNKGKLVLAALLSAMLLVVAGSFGWMASNLAAQHGRNAEAVAALLDRCEDALRADRTEQAALALEVAGRRAADGGAEDLAGRLARCQADLTLLRALDAIDTFSWTWTEGSFPGGMAMATRWPAPLAAYGVTADKGHAAESAGRINGSLIRDRLLTALDLWLTWDPSAEVRAGVRAVLQAADPDPYRDAFRDALIAKDGDAVNALSARKEALDQPSRFSVIFGQLDDVPLDRQRAVLGSALRARPGDLALNMQMGRTYQLDPHPEALGEAARWYQAAAAAHPDYAMAHNNLGVALSIRGKQEEAAACYRQAIRIDPTFALGHSNLGDCHANLGDPEAAIACYEEAIRHDPKDAAPHHRLGMVLQRKGNPDRAIEAYRKAIQIDRDHIDAHMSLGAILCDVKRDYDGAIVAFKEAIRINPGSAPAHVNLGNALRGKGSTADAIAMFRKAIEVDRNHIGAHMSLGAILCDVNRDYDGAIVAFEEAIRINPGSAPAHLNLGNALRGKGSTADAIAMFRKAIEIAPDDADAYVNLGAVLAGKENQEESIAAYREAVRIQPDHALARANLGAALSDQGDVNGAIAELRIAHELDPKNPITRRNLANTLQRTGDLEGVIELHRQGIEIDPKDAGAHNNLAWLRATGPERVRDGKRAVEHATRACELTGWKEPGYIDTLAAAHAEAGDFAKALEHQRKALDFPAFVEADGEGGRQRLELYAGQKAFRDPAFIPREGGPP